MQGQNIVWILEFWSLEFVCYLIFDFWNLKKTNGLGA